MLISNFIENCAEKESAPGEARTRDHGIARVLTYKYRALTNCATGALVYLSLFLFHILAKYRFDCHVCKKCLHVKISFFCHSGGAIVFSMCALVWLDSKICEIGEKYVWTS